MITAVLVFAIGALCVTPVVVLMSGAHRLLFGTDEQVSDVAVTESGHIYYTLETTEAGDSSGERTLWHLRHEGVEPESLSIEPSCEYGRDYSGWQITGPDSAMVTVACWGSGPGLELWEFGTPFDRAELVDTGAIDAGARDSLYYAGAGTFYRIWRPSSSCVEIYVDSVVDGEVTTWRISDTLLDAAGIDAADTECHHSVERPRIEADQDGDLWVLLDHRGEQAVCEYRSAFETTTCHRLDLDDCPGFTVSRDGHRFACDTEDFDPAADTSKLAVFDAATAESVAEVQIPNEGAWTFYDRDTIAVLTDDQELATVDFAQRAS